MYVHRSICIHAFICAYIYLCTSNLHSKRHIYLCIYTILYIVLITCTSYDFLCTHLHSCFRFEQLNNLSTNFFAKYWRLLRVSDVG